MSWPRATDRGSKCVVYPLAIRYAPSSSSCVGYTPRTSYALKTDGSSTDLMLLAEPGWAARRPSFLHFTRGAKACNGAVRRPRRLDPPRDGRRSGGRTSACERLLRDGLR